MNKVILIGRLTRDPDIRYTQGNPSMCVARYTLAVDRPKKQDGTHETDFISCIAFSRLGEFAERYLHQGIKIAIEGRIQTGSYTNRDGQKVYTTDVVVTSQEFCQSLNNAANGPQGGQQSSTSSAVGAGNVYPDGFVDIPDNVEDEGLPFN